MKLKDLLKNISVKEVRGNLDIEIKELSQSAKSHPTGGLLFCYKGVNFDGHDYCNEAEKNGFVALVVEHWVESSLTQILVRNCRNIMPKVCNNYYNNITKKLYFVGVTGTNGKTTTASIIWQMLNCDGKSAGLIGTNGVKFADIRQPSPLTTPDTVDFFRIINDMYKNGIKYVVCEVSAHAIDLKKLLGIKFDVGIFTNLSQDHLDYFGNMGNYALCKSKFLKKRYCKVCIINTDDDYGKLFSKVCDTKIVTYGLKDPARCFACDISFKDNRTHFLANVYDDVFDISTNLLCEFNVYNLLSSMIACKLLGVSNFAINDVACNVAKIDGRMNVFKLKNGATAVVDFAHTPDALENALRGVRKICQGKVVLVFGCGGNRDRFKRPRMGYVASVLADKVIVTSDNPRFENAEKIASDIVEGITKINYEVVIDRRQAIVRGYKCCNAGDILLIAGKGAEDGQEINGIEIPFSDEEELKKFM